MLRTLALFTVILFAVSAAVPMQGQAETQTAGTGNLTVTVTNLHNTAGQVFVQLWRSPDGFPKEAPKAYKYISIDGSKIVDGKATATFAGIAPGTYAVSTLHDENRNGKMDNNFLGLPKEGWAVSNNIVTHTHAPTFDQSKIQVAPGANEITVAMHY